MTAPYVVRLLAGTLLGRLPNGMAPLAILLLVQHDGGTLACGGALCALYGLAAALGQPVLGRLVDRHGQTMITGSAAVLTSAALMALPAALDANQLAAANALVVLAGLSTPPLEAGLRALWPSVLPDPEQRRAALAMDTGSQGLIYIAGPPLTVALADAFGPATALVTAMLAGLAGAAIVLTAEPSRTWQPTRRRRPSLLGPLHHAGVRRLFTALAGVGVALGALSVWALDAAGRQHASWLAGTVPAALSVGSVAAGLLLARTAWPGTPVTQVTSAATAFAVSWLPLLADPAPWAAVVAVLAPGMILTPLITSAFLTTESLTRPGMVTEAYAWLIAAVGTGQAAGTALAGLTTAHSAHLAAALPALGAAFTAALLIASRHRMNTTRPQPHARRTDLAVRTTWTVDHQCGHRLDHDLSARRADERAGYARWLAAHACTDCWRTAHAADSAVTQEWIAARREQERADAAAWAAQYDMPPLAGSEKAVAWGERCRHQLITSAYQVLVAEGAFDEQQWASVEESARLIDRAGWWIDQRDADPGDLPELLAAATDADRTTENPYR